MPMPASPSPPPPKSPFLLDPTRSSTKPTHPHAHRFRTPPPSPRSTSRRHPRIPPRNGTPFFFSSPHQHEHNHTNLLLRPFFDSKTLLTSLHPPNPTSKTGPDRPPPPSTSS